MSLETHFWSKVRKGDSSGACWVWTAAKNQGGYGEVGVNGHCRLAHRVAWILVYGSIPDGLCVLHHCDNPPCVNPEHLFVGTPADNAADREAKGRGNQPTGDANGARLYPERLARGDAHWSRLYPEKRAFGDRNGSRLHPESRPRGDKHHARLYPDKLARGDASWSRMNPERLARGEAISTAKLTAEAVVAIRKLYATGCWTQTDLAALFGIAQPTVSRIVRRKTWAHI